MVSPLDGTIFNEEAFARVLSFERRRTDRSQRPFLLLLLELEAWPQDRQRQRPGFVKSVIQSLQLCTRQTDMLGWYKHNTVIGAIFTELPHEEAAIDKILERVKAALHAHLTAVQIAAITISVHVYPPRNPGA